MIQGWKRASANQNVRKLVKEMENIRDDVLSVFKNAAFDFVSQLQNLNENVDIQGIYEVYVCRSILRNTLIDTVIVCPSFLCKCF